MRTLSNALPHEDKMADVDIIIVNFESSALTVACIDSIYRQTSASNVDIWVIDNDSSDNPDQIKTRFPAVHLHRNTKNVGFAAAVNQAIKKGSAPRIILVNPDASVNEGLFDQALEYFREHSDVGILGPRILETDGSIQASARSFPTPLTALFGRQSLLSRLFPNNRLTKTNLLADEIVKQNMPTAVDWVSGACMLIRRKAVEEVGLLDDKFFMYWEDADWCRRMWKSGWKVIYYPDASVIHTAGESSRKNHMQSSMAFHQSAYRLYKKHSPNIAKYWWPVVAGALAVRFLIVIGIHFIQSLTGPFTRERS